MEKDLVLKKRKVYVPKYKKFRAEIIQLHHDVLAARHRERWKMMELVIRNYWWIGVTKDIEKYMDRCDMCQRMKNWMEAPEEKLMTNKIPEKPWLYLTVDFITKFPLVAGKDAILVVFNKLSKMTHLIMTTEETLVEGLVWLSRDNVWKLHELPKTVILDR